MNSANSINSIVIRGTNWIGDAVMSIPAMRELRRIFPDARITLHTRSWAEGLFQDAQFIDEIIAFDKRSLKLKDVSEQIGGLAALRFDLAVLLPNSFESALVAKLARVPRRFGYNKDLRGLLLTDPVAVPEWKNRRHEVFYYLNLVAAIEQRYFGTCSVMSSTPDSTLEVLEDRRIAARSLLAETGVDSSKKTVALGVGSTNSRAKRWGSERFAKLNDRLQAELNVNVVLVGSPDEMDVSTEVCAFSKLAPVVLTGKTDLAQAAAVLSEIDLLISNDMGLAHVAPAVGTRSIVIFGPTNPKTTAPFSENAMIIRRQVECSPCMLRDCPIDHRCMTRISVDEVFDAAATALTADTQL